MAGRKWTERERKLLKELYPQYMRGEITKDELCDVFDRSYNSIRHGVTELKLTGKAWDNIDIALYERIKKRIKI